MNTTTVIQKAKDLTKEPPRSPRIRVAGYAILARMVDKCRATLNGTNGEYHFNCPVDNMLFGFKGVEGEEVKQLIASGASDDDVAVWLNSHGTPKTLQEIKDWADATEALRYYEKPDKREWFVGECTRLGIDPVRSTLFDYLEADDLATFGKQ